MPLTERYRPETLHEKLGDEFFDPVMAAEFPQHILRFRNQRCAARVGLDGLNDAEWLNHFGRFTPLPGSLQQPLALRYQMLAGQQAQRWAQQLSESKLTDAQIIAHAYMILKHRNPVAEELKAWSDSSWTKSQRYSAVLRLLAGIDSRRQ